MGSLSILIMVISCCGMISSLGQFGTFPTLDIDLSEFHEAKDLKPTAPAVESHTEQPETASSEETVESLPESDAPSAESDTEKSMEPPKSDVDSVAAAPKVELLVSDILLPLVESTDLKQNEAPSNDIEVKEVSLPELMSMLSSLNSGEDSSSKSDAILIPLTPAPKSEEIKELPIADSEKDSSPDIVSVPTEKKSQEIPPYPGLSSLLGSSDSKENSRSKKSNSPLGDLLSSIFGGAETKKPQSDEFVEIIPIDGQQKGISSLSDILSMHPKAVESKKSKSTLGNLLSSIFNNAESKKAPSDDFVEIIPKSNQQKEESMLGNFLSSILGGAESKKPQSDNFVEIIPMGDQREEKSPLSDILSHTLPVTTQPQKPKSPLSELLSSVVGGAESKRNESPMDDLLSALTGSAPKKAPENDFFDAINSKFGPLSGNELHHSRGCHPETLGILLVDKSTIEVGVFEGERIEKQLEITIIRKVLIKVQLQDAPENLVFNEYKGLIDMLNNVDCPRRKKLPIPLSYHGNVQPVSKTTEEPSPLINVLVLDPNSADL